MMDSLAQYGYLGLLLASFLAATILPVGSEVMLGVLLVNDYNPCAILVVATVGNVAGSLVNYGLGWWGGRRFATRLLRLPPADMAAAEKRYARWGTFGLLFAWLPIIGDPLTVVAGALKTPIGLFLVLVTAGKMLRYIVVGFSVLSLADIF